MKARVINSVVVDLMEKPLGHADNWIKDDGTAEVGCSWTEEQGFYNQSGMPPQKIVNKLFYLVIKFNIAEDVLLVPPEAAALWQRVKDHIK